MALVVVVALVVVLGCYWFRLITALVVSAVLLDVLLLLVLIGVVLIVGVLFTAHLTVLAGYWLWYKV